MLELEVSFGVSPVVEMTATCQADETVAAVVNNAILRPYNCKNKRHCISLAKVLLTFSSHFDSNSVLFGPMLIAIELALERFATNVTTGLLLWLVDQLEVSLGHVFVFEPATAGHTNKYTVNFANSRRCRLILNCNRQKSKGIHITKRV